MQRTHRLHPLPNPCDACFSHSGDKLAIKNTSGRIVIVDTESGKTLVDYMNAQEGEGAGICFSPDDQHIIDASWEGYIYLRPVSGGNPTIVHLANNEMIVSVSSNKNTDRVAFLHSPRVEPEANFSRPEYVTVWNWPFLTHNAIRPNFDYSRNMDISPDGSYLAIHGYVRAEKQSYVRVYSISGRLVSSTRTDTGMCSSLRWSPDGSLIGVVLNEKIHVLSATELRTIKTYELHSACDVYFSPNLSFIALGALGAGSIEPFIGPF